MLLKSSFRTSRVSTRVIRVTKEGTISPCQRPHTRSQATPLTALWTQSPPQFQACKVSPTSQSLPSPLWPSRTSILSTLTPQSTLRSHLTTSTRQRPRQSPAPSLPQRGAISTRTHWVGNPSSLNPSRMEAWGIISYNIWMRMESLWSRASPAMSTEEATGIVLWEAASLSKTQAREGWPPWSKGRSHLEHKALRRSRNPKARGPARGTTRNPNS